MRSLVSVCLLFACLYAVSANGAPSPLLALYRFEGPAVGTDSSGNGNDLVIASRDNRYGVDSKVKAVGKSALRLENDEGTKPGAGNALSFAFDAFPSKFPRGNSPFTVAAWIRPVEGGSKFGCIVCWGEPVKGKANWLRLHADKGISHTFWGTSLRPVKLAPTDLYKKWTHVALTWDGDNRTRRLYVNGEEVGPVAANPVSVDVNVTASNFAVGFKEYFNGFMDDVAIFNTFLSKQQIKTIMAGNFTQYLPPSSSSSSTGAAGSSSTTAAGATGAASGAVEAAKQALRSAHAAQEKAARALAMAMGRPFTGVGDSSVAMLKDQMKKSAEEKAAAEAKLKSLNKVIDSAKQAAANATAANARRALREKHQAKLRKVAERAKKREANLTETIRALKKKHRKALKQAAKKIANATSIADKARKKAKLARLDSKQLRLRVKKLKAKLKAARAALKKEKDANAARLAQTALAAAKDAALAKKLAKLDAVATKKAAAATVAAAKSTLTQLEKKVEGSKAFTPVAQAVAALSAKQKELASLPVSSTPASSSIVNALAAAVTVSPKDFKLGAKAVEKKKSSATSAAVAAASKAIAAMKNDIGSLRSSSQSDASIARQLRAEHLAKKAARKQAERAVAKAELKQRLKQRKAFKSAIRKAVKSASKRATKRANKDAAKVINKMQAVVSQKKRAVKAAVKAAAKAIAKASNKSSSALNKAVLKALKKAGAASSSKRSIPNASLSFDRVDNGQKQRLPIYIDDDPSKVASFQHDEIKSAHSSFVIPAQYSIKESDLISARLTHRKAAASSSAFRSNLIKDPDMKKWRLASQ